MKAKMGISLDVELLKRLEALLKSTKGLGTSRSELIEAILTAFLASPFDHEEKVRQLVSRRRKGEL